MKVDVGWIAPDTKQRKKAIKWADKNLPGQPTDWRAKFDIELLDGGYRAVFWPVSEEIASVGVYRTWGETGCAVDMTEMPAWMLTLYQMAGLFKAAVEEGQEIDPAWKFGVGD